MNKSESIKEITKAIISVMKEVKGIDKTMTIGEGKNSYKGVSDKEVKKIIGEAMQNNGLAIVPISINPSIQISEWDEVDQWSKSTPKDVKRKQSVFTTAEPRYLLLHESGEYLEVAGYGHGIDSQDKGAGKATTYALKYLLLYMFMVPTGKIDDADNTHSDDIKDKPKQATIEEAVLKMNEAKTIDDIKTCWATFTIYQKEKLFIDACVDKQKQLTV